MGNSPPTSTQSPKPKYVTDVVLNVYEIVRNDKLSKLGFGIYHTGVEVFGREYSFGGGIGNFDSSASGIFAIPPRTAAPTLTEAIILGQTTLTCSEVDKLIKKLDQKWKAATYNILSCNCNHFSEALCKELGVGAKFPSWVNRAARVSDALLPNFLVAYMLKNVRTPSAPPPQYPGAQYSSGPSHKEEEPAAAPLPPIPDDLSDCNVRQLKTLMYVYNIPWEDCVERADLVARINQFKTSPAYKKPS